MLDKRRPTKLLNKRYWGRRSIPRSIFVSFPHLQTMSGKYPPRLMPFNINSTVTSTSTSTSTCTSTNNNNNKWFNTQISEPTRVPAYDRGFIQPNTSNSSLTSPIRRELSPDKRGLLEKYRGILNYDTYARTMRESASNILRPDSRTALCVTGSKREPSTNIGQ